MIPHSWIVKCLRKFGAAENMVLLLKRSMNEWQVELSAERRTFGSIKVRRGIICVGFYPIVDGAKEVKAGYDLASRKGLLNHILFMVDLKLYGKNKKQIDTLINIVRVFSSDIAMKFGIIKYAVLVMKRERYPSVKG